jgi:hypothetical protein
MAESDDDVEPVSSAASRMRLSRSRRQSGLRRNLQILVDEQARRGRHGGGLLGRNRQVDAALSGLGGRSCGINAKIGPGPQGRRCEPRGTERCIIVEVRASEIDALVGKGFLRAEARDSKQAIRDALYAFLDRTLGARP